MTNGFGNPEWLTPILSENKDPRPNRILAASLGGKFHVLYHQGCDVDEALKVDSIDVMMNSYPELDGIVVWEGGLERTGISDWPGEFEYGLVGKWRAATKEEWDRFIDLEWVWDMWSEAPER